jgi:hypothetical protein
MWNESDDLLDLDTSPEMMKAAELLENAGDSVVADTLPLKRLEALCATKCFDKIRDPWNMSVPEKNAAMDCVERCEEPMESIGTLLEEERNKILESATDCLERCRENDEACANQCIKHSITPARMDSMMSRIRSRILGYKYS